MISAKRKMRFKRYIPELIIGIVVSAALPLFSLVVGTVNSDIELYKNMENISIGTSEQYMEQCFGVPKLQNLSEDKEILENVYYTDKEIIRAYFVNGKLEGYFITLVEKNPLHKVGLPNAYKELVGGKTLGEFTYYEIKGGPDNITAYVTQGYSRCLYFEDYYFASSGRYNQFYFGFFDYGYEVENLYESDYTDDEVEPNLYDFEGIYALNRKKSRPNTYGICSSNYYIEIYDLVSNYSEFDWDLTY